MKRFCALIAVFFLSGSALSDSSKIAEASSEKPQYGGELNVGTFVVTLSALSWDPADWTWKSNHDTGMIREQLFVGDLAKRWCLLDDSSRGLKATYPSQSHDS